MELNHRLLVLFVVSLIVKLPGSIAKKRAFSGDEPYDSYPSWRDPLAQDQTSDDSPYAEAGSGNFDSDLEPASEDADLMAGSGLAGPGPGVDDEDLGLGPAGQVHRKPSLAKMDKASFYPQASFGSTSAPITAQLPNASISVAYRKASTTTFTPFYQDKLNSDGPSGLGPVISDDEDHETLEEETGSGFGRNGDSMSRNHQKSPMGSGASDPMVEYPPMQPEEDIAGENPLGPAPRYPPLIQTASTQSNFDIVEIDEMPSEHGFDTVPDSNVDVNFNNQPKLPPPQHSPNPPVGGAPASPDSSDAEKTAVDGPLEFLEQPGIIAAIVCGAGVGITAAIVLVCVLIRRVHKKDEGSYILDEPSGKSAPIYSTYPYYAYQRAPTAREFYA